MKSTVRYAFMKSLPVMFGYIFLGIAFGVLMQQAGFPVWMSLLISLIVYAGSMQFVLVTLLSSGASVLLTAAMTLLINSRHIFYGLSFVEKFKTMGRRYFYMIFSLTDETYSVLCSVRPEDKTDKKQAMFLIALFDQAYWVAGSVIGAAVGGLLPFDTTGIDFSMTALFVVIFLEQWLDAKTHIPAVVGLVSGISFLLLLGPDNFILPSLVVTVTILLLCRRKIEGKLEGEKNAD